MSNEQKLLNTARRLWVDEKIKTQQGKEFLEKKASILNLDSNDVTAAMTYIDNLEEAVNILQSLNDGLTLSNLSIEELQEYCEIRQCESDMQNIIEVYNARLSEKTKEKQDNNKSTSNQIKYQIAIKQEQEQEQEQNIKSKNKFWIKYYKNASLKLEAFNKTMQEITGIDDLVSFNLPSKINGILYLFESEIKKELISNANLSNPTTHFLILKQNLIEHAENLHDKFKIAHKNKDSAVDFLKLTLNEQSSFIPSISKWNKTRFFKSEVDRILLNTIEPIISEYPNHIAIILKEYYEILIESGYEPFDKMISAKNDAEHILKHIDYLPTENDKLAAIKDILIKFPFTTPTWLENLLVISNKFPEQSIKLLSEARENYTGQADDLKIAELLINNSTARKSDKTIKIAKELECNGVFSFNPKIDFEKFITLDIDPTPKFRFLAGIISNDIFEFINENKEDICKLKSLLAKNDQNYNQLAIFINICKNLKEERLLDASILIGKLISTTNEKELKEILCGFFIKKIKENNDCTSAQKLWIETTKSLKCDADKVFKNWMGTGQELLYIASCLNFSEGNIVSSKEFAQYFGNATIPSCICKNIPWLFKDIFAQKDLTNIEQKTYLSFLLNDLLSPLTIPAELFQLTYENLNTGCPQEIWITEVINLAKAIQNKDDTALDNAAKVLAGYAKDKLLAVLYAIRLTTLIKSEVHKNDFNQILKQLVYTGIPLDEISTIWECRDFIKEYQAIREENKKTLKIWIDACLEKSKTTNKQFIARSPNSKPISENDALNYCRLVEQYLATSNGCLNPKHLIARWDEKSCTVMFLTYGIVFIDKNKNKISHWLYVDIEQVSESGFINNYLKIKTKKTSNEIPMDITEGNKAQFNSIIEQVNLLISTWNSLKTNDSKTLFKCFANDEILLLLTNSENVTYKEKAQQQTLDELDNITPIDELTIMEDWKSQLETIVLAHQGVNEGTFYVFSDMDQKKLGEFISRHSKYFGNNSMPRNEVLAFYDETVFGIGDRGLAIGIPGIAWTVDGDGLISWTDISSCKTSGILNRKLEFTLKTGGKKSMVLTQGNKAADSLQKIINSVVNLMPSFESKWEK